MRLVNRKERKQRGCTYCADTVELSKEARLEIRRLRVTGELPLDVEKGEMIIACRHAKCPYHELDRIKNYMQYDKMMERGMKRMLKRLEKDE